MKNLFCLLISICSISAYGAFSTEPDDSRSVSDLMYLPEAGKWFVELAGGTTTTKTNATYLNTGANFYTSDGDSLTSSLTLGGVMEGDLLYSIKVPYQIEGEDSTVYGPASTSAGVNDKTKSKGPGDIEVDFKWRVLTQSEKGVKLDVKLNFSPKTGHSETASTTKEGSNFRGGTNFGFGVEAGKKLKNIQFSGEANLDFNGSREVKSLSNNTSSDISSFNSISIGGTVQLQPNEKFFLNAGILFFGGMKFDSINTGTTTKYDVDSYVQIGGAAGYKISNSISLRLIYSSATVDRKATQGLNNFDEKIEAQNFQGLFQIQF